MFPPSAGSTINRVYFLHRSVMQSGASRESVECITLFAALTFSRLFIDVNSNNIIFDTQMRLVINFKF